MYEEWKHKSNIDIIVADMKNLKNMVVLHEMIW